MIVKVKKKSTKEMMISNVPDNGRRHSHWVPIMGGTVIKMLKDKGKQQSYVKKKKL